MNTPEEMGIDTTRRNAAPRPLTDSERARLDEFVDSIHYSTRYFELRISPNYAFADRLQLFRQ